MPKLKPLYQLYKGLKANNFDVPDNYTSFERTLCAPGNEGARNRRTIYAALKKQNFDVPDSYESFYRTLFKPVSRTSSIAIGSPMPKRQPARPTAPKQPAQPVRKPVQPAGKGTPMTAAQKQVAVQSVNNLVAGAFAGLQRTMNQMDYARATGRLLAGTPRLGQQATVVRRDAKGNVEKIEPALNQLPELDAKDSGATYLTAAGNEYTDRTQAENEQMQLARQEKEREANQNREALLRKQRAKVVEKMMARGKELDKEALQFSWRDIPRGMGGAVHTWNSSSANGRFFDKTYKNYMAQLAQIDDALATISEGKKGRESDAWINSSSNWFTRAGKNVLAFGAGTVRGLNHAVGKVSTWDMGMTDNNTNMALLDAARNAQKKGFAHITPEEQHLLTLAAENRLAHDENKAHIGWGYQVGEITGESLPYMIETMANPLSNTGKVAANQLTKWALKRWGKKALEKASKKYAAAKIGTRVLGDIAGSAGMAATTGQGRVTADALQRLTGDVKYKQDAAGNIMYDGTEGAEDDALTAYLKAFGAQTIENHSEMVGEYFAPLLGKVGKIARKGMEKVGLEGVSRFIDTVGATNFSRMLSDFERQTKWNGTIGEYAEEVVGNIENALLVGDNTLDTADGTGVFNLEQNVVTFLGVGLMGGLISGAKTLSYRTPKRRALSAMNEAGKAVDRAVASSPYWMDKWGGWRNTLLVGTAEEKQAALVDALSDKELPMGFRQAILDYAKAAQEYEGLCRMQKGKQEEGTQDPIASAYDASYDRGYGTTDRDAMNGAKNRLWLQREAVARELGLESADKVDEVIGDPLEYIEAQRQAGKQPGELQTVVDYANAKSEYEGMVARVRDEIDDKVAAEHREIDHQVNQGDGMIHRATLKEKTRDGQDRHVYVVSGTVVMQEDGNGVDMSQSDESIVVRDAQTGELSQVSPDALLTVDTAVDPAEEKQQAEQAISQEMARAAADNIDGTVAFAAGDAYTLRAEDGSEQTVRVMANAQGVVDNGDGTVNVTLDGKTVVAMDKAAIQRGVDAARRAKAEAELAQERSGQVAEPPSEPSTEAEAEQPTSDAAEQAAGEAPSEAPMGEEQQAASGVPEYGVNDNFTMTLPNGTPVRGTVQGVTADGVEVWTETPVEGKRVQVLPREEFEGMVTHLADADGNAVWSRDGGTVAQQDEEVPAADGQEQEAGTKEDQPVEPIADTPSTEEGTEGGEVSPEGESDSGNLSPEGGEESSADANNNVSGTSVNKESALSRVPKDEQGEPVYEQTDAETAWDAIVEQTGGNSEMAQTVAESMVADKEAALKKAEKAKPRKGGTVAEKITAEQERLAAIEQAKQDLAHWQKIAGVEQQRKQEAALVEQQVAETSRNAGLNDNEADDLLSQMENNAVEMPQMELNPTNWEREFGEDGTVATPIGQVKMGENQIAKLFEKGRSEQFGMIKPTLEHPQVIIEVPSDAKDGNAERNSSLLFVKTFIGKDGKKIYYFKSVTVKKDGLEVSVSSHYDRAKRVGEALKKGKLLYRFDGGAQTEHHPAGASVTTSQENEQGTSAGKGTQKSGTTQAEDEKLSPEQKTLRGVPDWVEDTPQAARRRGYRRSNGARYDRQAELVDGDFKPTETAEGQRAPIAVGKEVEVKFSDRDKQSAHVVVMEAEQVQPSHQNGQTNVLHFIPEAQPKARTDEASVLSSEKIAASINPAEITSSVTAYTGAPTVNARGEVIQGNNRSAALKTMWASHRDQGAKYKQYLMDHAAEFGLKAEDIAGMAHPVLVNMAAVDDSRAVELGQYDVKDTESGGMERIKPRNAAMKMGADMQTFASMLLKSEDEDASFSQLVDRNGLDVLQWMQTKGYITATQYKSALNSRGDLTAEASNDLKGILYQSIFQNGSERLEEMFNALPVKAQRAILGTAYRDLDSPETERMVPEIQQSIMAYHELMQDESFAGAKNMKDAQTALMMWQRQYKMDDATGESYLPTEKYSNFALQLAAMYKVQTQRMVQGTFNRLYDLIQGTQEADLFNQDTLDNTPRTLAEAIKEALNIDYNGQQRSNVLVGSSATSQQREQGSPEDAAADGRGESGSGIAEREGSTDAADDNLSSEESQSRQEITLHDPRSMSDEEKQRRGEMLRDATAVEVAEGQIVATAELSARKAAEKWWQDNVPEPVFYDTEAGEVEINQNSIEDSLAHRYGQAKLDAITSLVDGFENAVYLGTIPDFVRTRTNVVNHYFAYPIIYKGERCYVFCRAMQDENKNRLYVHEVFVADKIEKGNTLQTAASKPHGGIALYRDILANVLDRSTSEGKGTDNLETTQGKGSKSVENNGVKRGGKAKGGSKKKKSDTEKREVDKYGVPVEAKVFWRGEADRNGVIEGYCANGRITARHDTRTGVTTLRVDIYDENAETPARIRAILEEEGYAIDTDGSSSGFEEFDNYDEAKKFADHVDAVQKQVDCQRAVEQTISDIVDTLSKDKVVVGTLKNSPFNSAFENLVYEKALAIIVGDIDRNLANGVLKAFDNKELYRKIEKLVRERVNEDIFQKAARIAKEEEKKRVAKKLNSKTAKVEAEEKPKNSGQFGLVSDERMEELKKRLRQKLSGQLNMGIDPEILAIGMELAAGHIDRGIKKFGDFAKVMVEDLGDVIRPYLKAFYNGARDMPEVADNGLAAEMTPYDEVRTFDVANFDKAATDALATAEQVVAEHEAEKQAETATKKLKEQRNEQRRKAAVPSGTHPTSVEFRDGRDNPIYADGTPKEEKREKARAEAEIDATDLPKPAKDKAKRALHGSDSMTDNAALAEAKRRIDKKKKTMVPQTEQRSLFDEPITNENDNGLQRNDDAVRTEAVQADRGGHREGLSERTESGSKATEKGRETVDGTGAREGTGTDRTVQSRPASSVREKRNTRNNHAERGEEFAPKSVDARIDANIKAIELAHELLESGETATPEQMSVLRRFSGWGGLGASFGDGGYDWKRRERNQKIRELLGNEAYEQAVLSANSAYYTPAYVVDTLWDIAARLGFKGGRILEGSAGIGNILGQMPTDVSERSDIHAVEIDGTSGGILSLLYPDAKVEIQGFEQTRIPNGSVDLAITNVPFVTGLHVNDTTGDSDLSKKFRNIHDFCIAKNVRKLREGGLGIFITSSGTLDSSKQLREWVTNEGGADFVGAFRMNNKTFGGTPVTSDIIVIRKRVNGQSSPNAIDVSTISGERMAEYDTGETRKVKGKEVPVVKQLSMDYNKYFIEHPENMAGEMHFGFEKGDTYRPTSKGLYPVSGKEQKQMLETFVQSLSKEEGAEKSTAPSADEVNSIVYDKLGKDVKEGSMVVDGNGRICLAQYGVAVPVMSKPKTGENATEEELIKRFQDKKIKKHTKAECFQSYSAIKTALNDVLAYQRENESDEGLQPLLDKLNKAYDDFVKTYGHFTGNGQLAWLRRDVDYANVASVETFEEKGDKNGNLVQTFGKADVMNGRVVEKEYEPHPENVKDGVVVSMFRSGRIDVPYIASQLGMSEEDVKQEIIDSGLGFEDPASRQMEVSYQYLSGNVREKLRLARENNEGGRYDKNIKALEDVKPMDIPSHLIDFTLGSSWIDSKLYDEYVKDKTDVDVHFTAVGGTWFMNAPEYGLNMEKNRAMGVTSEMLHRTVFGHALIEAAIQNRTITVSQTQKKWDGTTETITDREATQACAAKIDEIRQDFKEWARQKMQSNAEMSQRMERVYNDTFNNYVPMRIPDDFVPEYFGGASHKFKMRPHQGRAIVRGTMQPLLLAHEVGTGKTFTLISTAMEMRRLGTARKPMIVVQNATVGQFVASAKELYPNAKILTLEDADRNAEGRKNFYAKIKYNDWDMIVVPQSTFEFIPDSEEREMAFVQDKIHEKEMVLEKMREADKSGKSAIVRQAERELKDFEQQLADLSDKASKKRTANDEKKKAVAKQNAAVKAQEMLDRRTDDVDNFDDMGIDALLIDEAHEYKHLGFATAMQRGVKGVDSSYSKKSQGVYLKTQAVLEKSHGRNVIFATGTPISNTAAEIWTFMRYLMPKERMEEYGIYYFDDFVRNFGNIQQMLEFTTSGKFKESNRFAGYVNLPELVRIWSSVSDTVLTREAGGVKEKIPELEGGKAQDIYLPQTRALRGIMKYVKHQLDEYDKMSGKEKKENSHIPLTMYGIAKAAAVDARLVQSYAEDDPKSKTNEAVRQTLRSLKETESYKGTVAIFADNYQNKLSGFNLYEDIRKKLIEQGVPANEIVVMKSGMTVKKKLDIFDKVNRGEVRVILGSTFTLGTGVNIQERLHTLIHLDAPNRPMDYTQRNGRILRQGNLHKEMGKPVRVLRFGVEDSLDVTAYQRLKTKGAIADSVMNGKELMQDSMNNRVLEEDEDVFGDTVAQLSGSEYAMLKNNAEKNVRKYESRRKQWEADQTYIHNAKPRLDGKIKADKERAEKANEHLLAVQTAFPVGKAGSIKVGKKEFASVDAMTDFIKEHNKKILDEVKDMKDNPKDETRTHTLTLSMGGYNFTVKTEMQREMSSGGGQLFAEVHRKMTYSCPELGLENVPVKQSLLRNAIEDITENVITGKDFAEQYDAATRSMKHNQSELEQIRKREGKSFEYENELEEAKRQYAEYSEAMKKEMEEKEKKYAEMDKDVQEAEGVGYTDEEDDDADEDMYRIVDDEELGRVNEHFNEQVVRLTEENADKTVLSLGRPSVVLQLAGVRNLPMKLYGNKVIKKMRKHGFTLDELLDLPKAVANPISVFNNYQRKGNRSILTELKTKNGNFLVTLNTGKGEDVDFNIVSSVFGKGGENIADWLERGLATYINKEKALNYLHHSALSAEALSSPRLLSAAKVVENFENPKELGEKDSLDGDLYRVVDDAATVARLDSEPKMTAYRAMQVIDGRLYSPMAAKVDGRLTADNPMGAWTEAEETLLDFTPEQEAAMKALDESGKKGDVELVKGKLRYHKESEGGRGTLQFHLVKGDGTSLWAAYNPYIHSSLMMLNDQFTSAYKRPNIVVVEVEIPKSELTSGYRAVRAKDPVGMAEWKAGPVAGQLPSEMGRKVMLSRWSKVKRIVPYSEVADHVASILEAAEVKKGKKLTLPIDSFHPELRKALEARGFKFEYGQYTKEKTDKNGNVQTAWDEKSDAEKQKAYKGATYMDDAAIKELNAMLGGEWIQREGDGAVSDGALSLVHDPVSKLLGKSRWSPRQQSVFAARERERMAARVQELAEQLHLNNVEVVMDGTTLTGKRSRAKGFYNRKTGKITIVVGNHQSLADVERTVLHESVAHYGLRELFGEQFDTFLDNVYQHAELPIRQEIAALAQQHGWNFRTATEEYLAQLAEDTDFKHMNDGGGWYGWWTFVKQAFLDMLHKIGFKDYGGPELSDNELRYILWRSYENLKEPGRYRSILGEAEDVSRQMALKVGNYAEEAGAQAMVGEEQTNVEAIKQKVADLFEKARTGEFKGKPVSIGRLSEAGKAYLEKLSGVPFKQHVDFVLNPSDLLHIYKGHYEENEKDTGNNEPLAIEDVKNIVDVISSPEAIVYGTDKEGKKLFFFLKSHGDGTYNLAEIYGDKRGNLTAKSFYNTKKKGISQRVNEIRTSLHTTSTTSGASLSSAAKIPTLLELNKQMQEKVESDADDLFRDGDAVDYDKAQARDRYEARVRSGMYQMQEALQDSMLGLKEAMDAILMAEGKKGVRIEDVAGFENAYLGENRLSSVNQAESVEFARRVFQPLLDEVNALAPTADGRAELTDYMMAKHGLERNKVMARRDAERKAEKEVETAVLKLAYVIANKHTDAKVKAKAQQKTIELQSLLIGIVNGLPAAEAQRWYSIRRKAIDTRYRNGHYTTAQHKAALHKLDTLYNEGLSAWYEEGFRQRDYAGLTALTGTDDVVDAEMEARQMVDDYEREHDTTALWEKTKAVNAWTLQKTYDSGMISKKVYDEIQGMYEYYIPLRGFDEKTSEEAYAYLQDKRSALNSPIKTAKGRKSKADDPLANMSSMAESAIMQGNRNVLVKQKFLNFVLNHPSDLVSVSDLWLRYDAAADEWKPVSTGDVAGTEALEEDDSPAEVERKMQEFEEAMEKLAAYAPDTYKRQKEHPEIPYRVVDRRDLKQHQVLVKRGGKDYVLTINGNPRAAQALNGQTNPDNDMTGAIGAILRGGEMLNRQLSALYTTRNPDFVVSNFMRDALYANTMVWVKEHPNYALRFHANFAKLNPAKVKQLLKKQRQGTLDMTDETERLFAEFMANGGETGYTSLKNLEQHKQTIAHALKKNDGKLTLSKAWDLLGERFEELNRAVENCARFAAYVTSREMKRSIDRSVYDAKEISVNFNKKGAGSKFMDAVGQTKLGKTAAFTSGAGRSLYVFWNAALQGTTNFGRQVVRHPKKSLAGMAAMLLLGALMASMGGDDDDKEDTKDSYYNLPEYVRRSNIVFRLPGMKEQWISIPLPVEYRAIYGLGELMTSVLHGKEHYTAGEIASQLASQISQMLPIDVMEGGGGWKAFVPSSVKPFAEVMTNKSWTGMPLYKDNDYNKADPEWTKAYKSANPYLVGTARWLNEVTGGDKYTSGLVDINPSQVEYLLNGYFGGVSNTIDKLTKTGETLLGKREYDPRSFLIVNRLLKNGDERTEQRAVNNEYFRLREEHDRTKKRLKGYENDRDNGVMDYAEQIDFLYNSPEYERMQIYESYAPDIDAISKELKEPMSDEDRKKTEADLNDLKRKLVEKANATRK